MSKRLVSRQPLIVTKVEFAPAADDVNKRKIQQVMELLLRKPTKEEKPYDEERA